MVATIKTDLNWLKWVKRETEKEVERDRYRERKRGGYGEGHR